MTDSVLEVKVLLGIIYGRPYQPKCLNLNDQIVLCGHIIPVLVIYLPMDAFKILDFQLSTQLCKTNIGQQKKVIMAIWENDWLLW